MSTTPPRSPTATEMPLAAGLLLVPQHNWKWFLVRGIVAIALGIVAMIFPGFTLLTFAMLFAAFSFVDGVSSLIAGIRGAREDADRWGALIFSGVTGIVVGVAFFLWPLLATATYAFLLVLLIAFWALITGTLEIAAAIRLRQTIEGEIMLAFVGVLSVLLGLALVVMLITSPGATLLSIGWLIGAYMLVSGIALVVLALRLKRREMCL